MQAPPPGFSAPPGFVAPHAFPQHPMVSSSVTLSVTTFRNLNFQRSFLEGKIMMINFNSLLLDTS